MERHEFAEILRKYRNGTATPEEIRLVDEWYASMSEITHYQDIPDESELEQLYRSAIQPHLKTAKKSRFTRAIRYSVAIAASIVIAIVAGHYMMDNPVADNELSEKVEVPPSWKLVTNESHDTKVIFLPDSSKVSLAPKSSVKFSPVFNNTEREVYLEGEAYFEVTHNPVLPFFVYANEVTTKVLGTSFVIKAIAHEEKITVSVKSGKVSVYTNQGEKKATSPAREIILTPNQQIVFDKKEKEITKTLVEDPQVIVPKEELRLMRFEEAPVSEIFNALEKVYGVDIEFDEAVFSSCELTTVIAGDGIYNRLDIICDAIGTSYTLEEDRILINGTGCKSKSIE